MVIFVTYRRRKLVIPLTLNKQLISLKTKTSKHGFDITEKKKIIHKCSVC